MNILTAKVIDNLINIMNFKYDNAEKFSDSDLSNYIKYIHILDLEKSNILEMNDAFCMEDLQYSRYYWFLRFKNRYFDLYGHDEGLEQQAFKLLEDIVIYLNNGIDWSIIESIANNNNI